MKVSELLEVLSALPPKAEVYFENKHDSIPLDRLGEDEYDDYGGLPDGTYTGMGRSAIFQQDGKVIIRTP